MKALKILIAMLAIIGVVFSFAACGNKTAGTYILTVFVESDGDELQMGEISEEETILKLNEDGTGTFCFDGEAVNMRYDEDYIWEDGRPDTKVSYKIEGKTLTMYHGVEKAVFKKN